MSNPTDLTDPTDPTARVVREVTTNPMVLARMAECSSPDTDQSPGARWLTRVRDSLAEDLLFWKPEERVELIHDDESHDVVHEAVGAVVPIYTRELWEVFVDLGAWGEDPRELGFEGDDMDQGARYCLYIIGNRLACRLLEEMHEELEELEILTYLEELAT